MCVCGSDCVTPMKRDTKGKLSYDMEPAEHRLSSSRSSSCNVVMTAADELAMQINDCRSLFPCIDAGSAVASIRSTSPSGRTVVARVPWTKSTGTTQTPAPEPTRCAVEVRFGYAEGFVCDEKVYEALLPLLLENGLQGAVCVVDSNVSDS
ncbi:hypothetical protein, conserved [Trypanosoma brucei gambiense DAL972]|uniref:Uncharacterized protein n=2 Tax=Trypanosoma brucei TaxID=5691 RepID=C9ZUU7_TRYB9|nr:hypothetical protein, conserved [Trypanosoma brucei gambiense DAL972]RHW71123.1 hypothetical protein DPX39_080017700 [Trypanosoma brucei equiperdum]CBH13185.1 hypothetical protein, conserved [Trypanosoma brucei gambiense DAL972]|eukprot:XP_011775462.1 hypothetical protein, conserved [Trypanosoma brucei gambiense DAL972]